VYWLRPLKPAQGLRKYEAVKSGGALLDPAGPTPACRLEEEEEEQK